MGTDKTNCTSNNKTLTPSIPETPIMSSRISKVATRAVNETIANVFNQRLLDGINYGLVEGKSKFALSPAKSLNPIALIAVIAVIMMTVLVGVYLAMTSRAETEEEKKSATDLFASVMAAIGVVFAVAGVFAVPHMTANSISALITRTIKGVMYANNPQWQPPTE
jgi:cytochrome bd-type quinol oxidase subunit 2